MREDDGFAIHRLLRHSRAGLNLTPYVIPVKAVFFKIVVTLCLNIKLHLLRLLLVPYLG
ncbi:hypothetical protein SHEWT2_04129 [Shewanella hafniensis]|nr:hypothetical protein SHEWT2_04129 [Shewanella hafniensis]